MGLLIPAKNTRSTTIVVAPADAPTGKQGADYVLQGAGADEIKLKAATDELIAEEYGELSILAGTIVLGAKWEVGDIAAWCHLLIKGQGNYQHGLKGTRVHGDFDDCLLDVTNTTPVGRLNLKNIRFRHNTSAGTPIALDLYNCTPTLEDVSVEDAGNRAGTGIRAGPMEQHAPFWRNVNVCHFATCFDLSLDHLIFMLGSGSYPTDKGFYVHDCSNVTLVHPHSFRPAATATVFYFKHPVQVAINVINPYCEPDTGVKPTLFKFEGFTGADAMVNIVSPDRFDPANIPYWSDPDYGYGISIGNRSGQNLIRNGGFDLGYDGWTVSNVTVAREATIKKEGLASVKLTSNGAWTSLSQNIPDYNRYKNKVVRVGCWCRCEAANDKSARLILSDGVGESHAYLTNDGLWHYAECRRIVSATATRLRVSLIVNYSGTADTDDICYFDGVILVEGDEMPAFSPHFDEVLNHTPASAAAPGRKGQMAFDANYIYICTADNAWERVAIAAW
jgi:hypothetical protein